MKEYDAIVVGAGPAGSFFSRELARSGYSVLLLEASDGKGRKLCGEYLCPAGVKLLEESDARWVLEGFPMLNGMKIYSPAGREVRCTFPIKDSKTSYGLSVHRAVFDSRMRELAQFESRVDLRLEHRVQEIHRGKSGWIVKSKNDEFQGMLLVGADGMKSIVARISGLRRSVSAQRIAVHCFANSRDARDSFGEMHLYEDGTYLGLNPTGASECNLGYVTDIGILKSHSSPEQFVKNRIETDRWLRERIDFPPSPLDVRVTCNLHNLIPQIVAPQCALIGDAACFVDPLTGEGMASALLSALLLSQSLKNWNSNHAESLETCLSAYALLHRKRFQAKIKINTFFQWLIKKPMLVEELGRFLGAHQRCADALVGMIGNVLKPVEAVYFSLGLT
ncbi:NAD(P)-binding protein [bacterium]|jgi:menaquinone-9 beta-reductase|nr:NAD(P)-binding protein [bacterium]